MTNNQSNINITNNEENENPDIDTTFTTIAESICKLDRNQLKHN